MVDLFLSSELFFSCFQGSLLFSFVARHSTLYVYMYAYKFQSVMSRKINKICSPKITIYLYPQSHEGMFVISHIR